MKIELDLTPAETIAISNAVKLWKSIKENRIDEQIADSILGKITKAVGD